MVNTKKARFHFKNPAVALPIAVLIVTAIGLGLYYGRYHKTVTIIPSQPLPIAARPKSGSATNNKGTVNTAPSEKNVATAAPAGAGPSSPTGTFISNHHPSLSGADEQKAEQSTCITTPGASCYIQFTKGSTVKTLASQTTDATGTAYWSWNISSSGFTDGSWQVAAVVSLNGQTKTTEDPLLLEVQP